jgi:hypothetical protein
MPITPQDFVSKWKRVSAREKQTYQEHFLDICQLVAHQTPNDYDPSGTRFAFVFPAEERFACGARSRKPRRNSLSSVTAG